MAKSCEEKMKVPWKKAQIGNWRIDKFTVKKGDTEALRQGLRGRPIPTGVYTRLVRLNERGEAAGIMMSDTPAEMWDMLYAVHRATGRVLVNGLGLGVYLRAILKKKEVKHVTVVEKERDVVDLISPYFKSDLKRKRVQFITGDAFTMQWHAGVRWNFAWHDIWEDICADNLPQMTKLHRKYGRRVDEQASWCRAECRRLQRESREENRIHEMWAIRRRILKEG